MFLSRLELQHSPSFFQNTDMPLLVQTSLSATPKHDRKHKHSSQPRSFPTEHQTVASDSGVFFTLNLRRLDRQIDHHLRHVSTQKLPPHFDRDDLRQSIYVAIIESCPNYDPARSSRNTFCDRVIRRTLRKQLSSFRWQKNRGEESLEDDTVDLPTRSSSRGDFSEQEYALFQTEVQNVIAALPDDLKTICEMLMYYLPQEIACKLKTSKGVVQRRMEKIRTIFRAVGMTPDYFEENSED